MHRNKQCNERFMDDKSGDDWTKCAGGAVKNILRLNPRWWKNLIRRKLTP